MHRFSGGQICCSRTFSADACRKSCVKVFCPAVKDHPGACKCMCVWPPLRNVKYLSFVCCGSQCVCSLFVYTCKSAAHLCNLGTHHPSHVSHYWLADSVIGDKAASFVLCFFGQISMLSICGKVISQSLILLFFKLGG